MYLTYVIIGSVFAFLYTVVFIRDMFIPLQTKRQDETLRQRTIGMFVDVIMVAFFVYSVLR